MHFCPDEMLALVAALGAIPVVGPWCRAKLAEMRRRWKKGRAAK